MREPDAGAGLARRLLDWFDTPLGRSLQARGHRLREILPQLRAGRAQLSRIGGMDMLETSSRRRTWCWSRRHRTMPRRAYVATWTRSALAFGGRGAAAAYAGFRRRPHAVLREVTGCWCRKGVVVSGSIPSACRAVAPVYAARRNMPWCSRFIRLARVKDWSNCSGSTSRGCMLHYRRRWA